MGIKIAGWGHFVPDKVLTNQYFEQILDTSDEWILERTGIKERHVGGTVSELASSACRMALEKAGLTVDAIDGLVLSTSTPEMLIPANSSILHKVLGLKGFAFDVNAACSGFVNALVTGYSILEAGHYENMLVCAGDTLSRFTDYGDRTTAVLFGDGAGAVVLKRTESDANCLLAFDLGTAGEAWELLTCEHDGFLSMKGKEVFRLAVKACVDSATITLKKANVSVQDVKYFIFHQANLRIISAICERLKIEESKTARTISEFGNTSSSSIPIALSKLAESNLLEKDDLVLLCGFGAGMTWASALIRWGEI